MVDKVKNYINSLCGQVIASIVLLGITGFITWASVGGLMARENKTVFEGKINTLCQSMEEVKKRGKDKDLLWGTTLNRIDRYEKKQDLQIKISKAIAYKLNVQIPASDLLENE